MFVTVFITCNYSIILKIRFLQARTILKQLHCNVDAALKQLYKYMSIGKKIGKYQLLLSLNLFKSHIYLEGYIV